MRLTIIPSDNTIIKDGQPLVFPFSAPTDLHAIQWYGTWGFIETTDGKQKHTADIGDILPYLTAYAAEASRLALIAATPPLPAPVPTKVTMRQARLALLGSGALPSVESTIAGMPGVAGEAVRIEWEYAATVERHSPLVAGLSAALNLSEEQLDQLFSTAATL